MDMEANDETTSRSSKTPPILKIFVAAIIGVMAVGGVYHLHEAGSVQANSNEVTNLAGVETTDIVKKFLLGFWDGSTLDYGTADATIAPPPGKQIIPMKAVLGMMPVFRKAWPKMHAKVWGVEKTDIAGGDIDGRVREYTVDFQALFGPMTGDMPQLGAFPAVLRSSVPDYVKNGISFPVERVKVTVNDAGTKVESAVFTGVVTKQFPADVSPEVEKIWGGDVEGFGAIYALCGANLPGPKLTTQDVIEKFLLGFWDGSTLDYGTEEATIAPPPGKQKMPMKAVVGMMPVFRKAWPKMHAKVWGVEKNADGTYTADFQAVFGPMTNDMPALGPFPAVSRSSVPRYVKSGITFPVEKVTVKVNEAGTKVESALYTGIVTTKYPSAYTLVSPEVERIWGGDVEGFGAIYALCGA